jgi:iron complex transport system ATP-binding protein
MTLEARHLSFAYGSASVLSDVTLALRPGITAIIGPNAAGKSTLLKCLAGLLRTRASVWLEGRDIATVRGEELSRAVSYMPQDLASHAALTVFETVLMGRLHRLSWRVSPEDREAAAGILAEVGLSELAGRRLDTLSGGQAQLAFIAQALARQPRVLLMDEPTSSLDMRHQFQIGELVRTLTVTRGICTAMALHDLNIASRFADTVCVMERGRVIAQGDPTAIVTASMIGSVYGVEACVMTDGVGRPLVCPLRACSRTANQTIQQDILDVPPAIHDGENRDGLAADPIHHAPR